MISFTFTEQKVGNDWDCTFCQAERDRDRQRDRQKHTRIRARRGKIGKEKNETEEREGGGRTMIISLDTHTNSLFLSVRLALSVLLNLPSRLSLFKRYRLVALTCARVCVCL